MFLPLTLRTGLSNLLHVFVSSLNINVFHHSPSQDRKQTFQQIDEVLNTKVAAKEVVGDIQVLMLHLNAPFLFFQNAIIFLIHS